MKKNETKLLASRAVNKIGNVMYDYGNSTWIAGLGSIGQKYMGYYQLAENVISLFLNPIGGAVADRFKRRQILLVTILSVDSCVPYLRLSETIISCFMD